MLGGAVDASPATRDAATRCDPRCCCRIITSGMAYSRWQLCVYCLCYRLYRSLALYEFCFCGEKPCFQLGVQVHLSKTSSPRRSWEISSCRCSCPLPPDEGGHADSLPHHGLLACRGGYCLGSTHFHCQNIVENCRRWRRWGSLQLTRPRRGILQLCAPNCGGWQCPAVGRGGLVCAAVR